MIKEFIATGKTIDEAIANAKAGLNAPARFSLDVKTEIIEMPKKKFLGIFGGSEAKAKAYYDDGVKEKKPSKKQNKKNADKNQKKAEAPKNKEQKKAEPQKKADKKPAPAPQPKEKEAKGDFPKSVDLEYAKNYLAEIVKGLDVKDAKISATYEEGVVTIDLDCDDYGIIIGRRGETLDSIQYLLSLAMKKNSNGYVRVSINVGNYREKRNETLRHLAEKNSNYVLRTGRKYTFEPMNPYERRIIHTAVQEIDGVESRSVGYNQDRRVVIEPVGGVKPRNQRGGRGGAPKKAATTAKPADYTPKKDRADLPKYGKIEINKD